MKPPDHYLVQQFQNGDKSAFDVLTERHYKRIYDYAYYQTRNVDDSYDIAQEVFFRAFKSLHNFKGNSTFYTWIYQIARNACVDYYRRRSSRPTLELTEEMINQESISTMRQPERRPDSIVLGKELEEQIRSAVSQLPEKQRQVFILRHFEGLSLQEIATIMDRSLGTIKAHLHHSTRKVWKLLEPYLSDKPIRKGG
ncbi:MAG: sigma-70 family RNA polymerase sigma factor [Candidatus Poribacteria bacterium]|nr:sigma-70 family RNA polymerase sigma factor [Candidatus Poribacteria bacterium]